MSNGGEGRTDAGDEAISPLEQSLRLALRQAMKEQDRTSISALRTALAAIDNARAVDPAVTPPPTQSPIAGATHGVGSGDVAARQLSPHDVATIVGHEVARMIEAADQYDQLGRVDQGARMREQAAVLSGLLRSP